MKKESQFSIRVKLLLIVGFIAIAFMGVAFYTMYSKGKLRKTISYLGNQRIPITTLLGDIRASSNGMPLFMWLSLAQPPGSSDRQKSISKVEEYWTSLSNSVAELDKQELEPQAKERLEQIKSLLPALDTIIHAALKAEASGNASKDLESKNMLLVKLPPLVIELTQHALEMGKAISAHNKIVANDAEESSEASIHFLFAVMMVLAVAVAVGGYLFSTQLSKTLTLISQKIADLTKQVASASLQVSSVSQQLSSTASEQASSVEETSASLEEMTGMVENNVRNAEAGLRVVEDVKSSSGRGNETMESLLVAMKEVMASNKRIEKLVKVIDEIGEKTTIIDEIVFQTKLLSFNASVEAERAGEHGRGFAVVAQEVGNLAQMSGKAALDISSIVKSSIKEAQDIASDNKIKVEVGAEQVKEAAKILNEIQKGADSVLNGSRQILSASKEQFVGFRQISTAMENINQATQETASSSEEAASAGEELSAHAQHLDSLVEDMNFFVTGHRQIADKTIFSKNPEMNNSIVQRKNNKTFSTSTTKKDYKKHSSSESNKNLKLVANGSPVAITDEDSKDGTGSGDWDRL